MPSIPTDAGVIGRDTELDAIARFLEGDAPGVLVLEGEPGIGKTTLWLAAIDRARELGQAVLLARPARVESTLSLAGLGDLLRDVGDDARAALPELQQHALAAALAEEDGGGPEVAGGRVLGLAFLGVLRVLAAERPLVVAIDDLQWLDEASAAILVYGLRRLDGADVRLLVSCRGEAGRPLPFAVDGVVEERSLCRLALGPLSEGATRRMLRLRLGLSLARVELHALYEASQGNPFYALELGRAGFELDATGSLHLPHSLRELVGGRLRTLPPPTREALPFVVALADGSERALVRAGVRKALQPALEADLLELESERIRFSHPLVGSAVWSETDESRRREIHRVLSEAVEDPEQRALHLAAVAEPPDPEVADLLEAAAASARRRGAPAAAADLLDRARGLTPEGELDRWARLAAQSAAAHAEAGHWDTVRKLADESQARLPPGPERAEILVTEAELRPGLDDLFRQAAAEAGESAVGVRAQIGLAVQAALSGRWAESVVLVEEAVSHARSLGDPALLGVALAYLGGLKLLDSQPAGRYELEESLAIEREVGRLPTSVYESPRMWQGAALLFGDDPGGARSIFEERLQTAVEQGDEMSAFQFKQLLVYSELRAGNSAKARLIGRTALEQVESFGYEYGRPVLLGSLAAVEACGGELDLARSLATESVSALSALGDRLWSTHALSSLVLTELCAGDVEAARAYADEISSRFPERECWWSYHQGDEIEALVLAGEHEQALARVEALRRAGDELALPRFLAWAERGEGLVQAARGDLPAARSALEAALVHHERFALPFERARTLLAYGHVLRREARRREARAALGEALAAFAQLRARHFAAAVREELKHVGGRPPAGEHELTGAEDRIARLVAAGLSNKEVAAQLFVSVSTVEAALTRVYRKLEVGSRSQLAGVLATRRG